jgi:hypothetical protein
MNKTIEKFTKDSINIKSNASIIKKKSVEFSLMSEQKEILLEQQKYVLEKELKRLEVECNKLQNKLNQEVSECIKNWTNGTNINIQPLYKDARKNKERARKPPEIEK